jgi:predicted nucleotidyltransferase
MIDENKFAFIPFKHSSIHKVSINVIEDSFNSVEFEKNVELMNTQWPTVKAYFDWRYGDEEVTVTFEHNHAGIVEEAAHQFVKYVRKFDWWKEVEVKLSYEKL